MSSLAFASVASLEYRDISTPRQLPPPEPASPPGIPEEQVRQRLEEAVRAAEIRWRALAEDGEKARRDRLTATMEEFSRERARYFRGVEAEVVRLSLAVARRILQREAEIEPALLVPLVRLSLERMNAGSVVRVRLPPGDAQQWANNPTRDGAGPVCEVKADDTLQPGDCVVETELGEANFGLEAQLREVEQGLLAVLAQRPVEP